MLSKSRGQILRVAAVMHALFHLETPLAIPNIISEDAIKAAVNFVELCNQHADFLSGRGGSITTLITLQRGTTIMMCAVQHYKYPLTELQEIFMFICTF